MKLLWMKAGGLLPLDTGGKIRSCQMLRHLARRHEVTAFLFYPRLRDDPHNELERWGIRVETVPMELAKRDWKEIVDYGRLLFSFRPFSIEKYYTSELRTKAEAVLKRNGLDAIVCDFIYPAGLAPWRGRVPVVLFTHNVEAQVWERQYKLTRNPLWKAACYLEYMKMARTERYYVQQADLVLTVSENDRRFFSQYVGADSIYNVPTGVDTDYFRPSSEPEEPNSLVFTGSLDWMPNEDAVLFGAQEILPRIQKGIPDVKFWVVGRSPPARLERLAKRQPALVLTGRVEDIRPYLQTKALYIVPMRSGSGTRLKIFEAMASGKAVLSTTIGAEGLPVTHGKDIILADDPGDFSRHAVRLLRSPEDRRRLGAAARRLVEKDFGWEAVAREFEKCLGRLNCYRQSNA